MLLKSISNRTMFSTLGAAAVCSALLFACSSDDNDTDNTNPEVGGGSVKGGAAGASSAAKGGAGGAASLPRGGASGAATGGAAQQVAGAGGAIAPVQGGSAGAATQAGAGRSNVAVAGSSGRAQGGSGNTAGTSAAPKGGNGGSAGRPQGGSNTGAGASNRGGTSAQAGSTSTNLPDCPNNADDGVQCTARAVGYECDNGNRTVCTCESVGATPAAAGAAGAPTGRKEWTCVRTPRGNAGAAGRNN